MDQGRTHGAKRSVYLSLFIGLVGLAGCKDRGEGPKSPESSSAVGEAAVGQPSADATGNKTETREIPSTNSNPSNSGSNTLPDKFVSGLSDCQKQNKYYDLQIASCTETPLADFACDLTVLLSEGSAVLNAGQKQLLKDYVNKNLQGFSLYACTVEESKPALHFYKVEADKIRAHNVKIAAP